MKVLYDYQAFDKQTHGGISRSFVQLYRHISREVEVQIAVRETDNVYLSELGYRPNGHRMRNFIIPTDFPGKQLLFRAYNKLMHLGYGNDYNRRYSIKMLRQSNYDVFHPTFFDPYFLPFIDGKPFVLTVHDLTPKVFADMFKGASTEEPNQNILIPKADAIVAISENTKRDILKFYPEIAPEKITVVYHGPSFDLGLKATLPYNPDEKYLLYVGHRWKYKNFWPLVKHLSPWLREHKDVKVICTGETFYDFEREDLQKYGVDGQFKHVFVRTDQEFIDLYHQALAFVYPSAYEGFGMPILEAFQAQTVCLLNDASCFPEIGGDAPLYFKLSDDGSDICEVVQRVYDMDDNERQAIIERQNRRLTDFSWLASARKLTEVYKSVI